MSTFHVYLIGGGIFLLLVIITVIASRYLHRPTTAPLHVLWTRLDPAQSVVESRTAAPRSGSDAREAARGVQEYSRFHPPLSW